MEWGILFMRINKSFNQPEVTKKAQPKGRPRRANNEYGSDVNNIAKQGLIKRARPELKISDSEIRKKLAEKNSTKNEKVSSIQRQALLNKTKIKSSFMQEEKKPMSLEQAQESAEGMRKSEVGINDPNDLATHGKLRSVIGTSTFGFSEKERAVLEKILSE